MVNKNNKKLSVPKVSADMLVDFFEIFTDDKTERISTKSALSILTTKKPWDTFCKGKPLNAHGLAQLLKPFDIKPKPIRVRGAGSQLKGYKKEDFDTLCS